MTEVLKRVKRADHRRVGNGNQSGRFRLVVVVAALCAATPVFAGCAPSADSSDLSDPDSTWRGGLTTSDEPDSAPAGVKNIALWTLPLDEFAPEFSNLDNYAEQLLLASCLRESGIEWPVPWQDVEEPTSPVFNPAGRRLLSVEIAQKYGFRTNLGPSRSAQLWEEFLAYEPTEPGFQDAFDECLAGIRKKYPILEAEDTLVVSGLVTQIQEQAFLSREGQEGADRWRTCMQPQGFGKLPDNPNEFPSIELQKELGSVPPVTTVDPSAREVEIATAHATCLDSSGFSEAMYEQEWKLQESTIQRERAKLDRVRDAVNTREDAVREIIAANAPRA